MSYLVLARKYRPQNFSEVYAQDHITKILKNSIELDRIAQAYLFTGTRGVGKTSMARIFAKSLNCLKNGPTISPCNECENCISITKGNSTDVIEIDGASNTGVDDIRDLQKELMYSTSNSIYKIYIIDEVHMLSKNAFNALLKTLEEPPDKVIFIFATTEPHKVLPTIISRCQRFDFKRIPIASIVQRLKTISEEEKIEIEEEAMFTIAKKADGSMRDALSLMDQVLAYGNDKITLDDILQIFGIVHYDVYNQMVETIAHKNPKKMINLLHNILDTGTEIQEFINGLLDYFRNFLLLKVDIELNEITADQYKKMIQISSSFSEEDILYLMSLLIKTKSDIKSSNNPILLAEMSFIKLTKFAQINSLEDIILNLENKTLPDKPITKPVAASNFQRKENILHRKTEIEKRKIVREVIEDKPEIKTLTKDILLVDKEQIIQKLEKDNMFLKRYLSSCVLDRVENNKIFFIASSKMQFERLKAENKVISNLFSTHYNLKIRINFELVEERKKLINKTLTLEDLKKESTKIANFIEILDPKAEIVTDFYVK
ncbi:MAG: DNA polymerase III subunit gamma/tau [Candidatus Cloacimonetes bacterium]|nr:DNA polymerase III subunit gamma/tau [Candidatus Cloacimonadota bacterium]